MMRQMSFLEVKELLRAFGIVIYTRDAVGDCLLIEDELKELYDSGLLGDPDIFRAALLAVRKRMSELKELGRDQ